MNEDCFELLPGCFFDIKQLSDGEKYELKASLWRFLCKRFYLYTLGDSSSISVETAEELVRSVTFTIGKAAGKSEVLPKASLLYSDLDNIFARGQKILGSLVAHGKNLWEKACISMPKTASEPLSDTLKGIGGFFKRYDLFFFAHRIPCDIDYQLCRPVPETLLGIDYINEYLKRILIENSILAMFDALLVERLLKHCCPDFSQIPINICEPVIVNAAGLLLLEENPFDLDISEAKRNSLAGLLKPLSEEKSRSLLFDAGQKLCLFCGIPQGPAIEYITQTVCDIYPRLKAALDAGDISNVFCALD